MKKHKNISDIIRWVIILPLYLLCNKNNKKMKNLRDRMTLEAKKTLHAILREYPNVGNDIEQELSEETSWLDLSFYVCSQMKTYGMIEELRATELDNLFVS